MIPEILYEDENLIAVNKPAGMIVNRADTAKNAKTLQDWVEENFHTRKNELQDEDKNRYMVNGYNKFEEFVNRSGIVHRLDKETSGIILIAKNLKTFINLQEQFKSGNVKKTYIALVHGKLSKEGEINEPIGRLPWNRARFGILREGREAKTLYKVLEYKSKNDNMFSLVEVYPQTGRTHQIRVHFQHLMHPIFADELYAGRKQSRDDRKMLQRHFLHATKIAFLNPKTNLPQEIISPMPIELSSFLQTLGSQPVD